MKAKTPSSPKLLDSRFYMPEQSTERGTLHLDETDYKLLELLAENSRLSNAELGRIIGLSRAAVRDRIARMLKFNIIEKFTISVNPLKVGREVSAFFEVEIEPDKLEEAAHILVKRKEVTDIYQMTGPSTLHCHGLLSDGSSLENFTQKVLYTLPGIKNVKTHVLLRRFKSRTGIRI